MGIDQGDPPNFCEWDVFDQVVSGFGLLEDVDWQKIFGSFYEMVMMKIMCRDA
jgi:hypothetical protein